MNETTETSGKSLKQEWTKWLNYEGIVKNIPFIMFMSSLAVVYIFNGHYADKLIRKISKTEKNIKELQYEYKTLKSEVIFRSKASELVKAVEPLGLKELHELPYVLTDSSQESQEP
jgi:hypothetical protein